MDEARARKLAANEALAREVNARVEEIASGWTNEGERMELLCECSYDECTERVHVTPQEYAEVRASDVLFFLQDHHVIEEIERRVGTAGDATIVEKIGPGREIATAGA